LDEIPSGYKRCNKFFWGREVLKEKYSIKYDFSGEILKVREQFR
jgi:hypothetical protein